MSINKLSLLKQFKNKKILITGHTGFKGSWLTHWLVLLGAKVIGLSIDIPSKPSHFRSTKLQNKIIHRKVDVRNLNKLKKIFAKYQPDYVFHLAGQAIVKKSYADPLYTWHTNTIGTLNVLESLREIRKNCVAVLITSDKSYKNLEIKRGYNENDMFGGKDPYSASKASAELVIQSYLSSFFSIAKTKVFIGVARAGNVIGGGDWSANRLIPDCVRSWSKNKKVLIRNSQSTRPWQHVLETTWGYLLLAASIKKNKRLHGEAFNFGPNTKNYKVLFVVQLIKKYWKTITWQVVKKNRKNFHESNLLKLNCNKAKIHLKWKCILSFKETISMTIDWYKSYYSNSNKISETSIRQIKEYEKLLMKRSIK